jgi:hypothetical protein
MSYAAELSVLGNLAVESHASSYAASKSTVVLESKNLRKTNGMDFKNKYIDKLMIKMK